jgi:hypothetical protein
MKSLKQLLEKAVSQDQQQAAAIALSVKRGDAPKSILKGASKEMYKMPDTELRKFAKTKHKGLPVNKESVVENDFNNDDEAGMMMSDLFKIAEYASELHDIMMVLQKKGGYDFPHWWQSKIVTAANNISSAFHYLNHELKMNNTLGDLDDYGYKEYDDDINEDCDCK